MKLSIVVAASLNNAIGKDNKLLWHLPNDMKFFKQTTWAMPVVMGRKTFESMNSKPLNGRLNIVITRQKDYTANGAVIVESLADAVFVAKEHLYKEIFIIGGGEIYKQALAKVDTIYLTKVDTLIEGDTFFPEIDATDFEMIQEDKHKADDKHAFAYSFQTWRRK